MPEPEKLWGLKFNPSPSYEYSKRDQRSQDSTEWFNPHQVSHWQEQGLIVWNSAEKRMERLSGQEALVLLGILVSQDNTKLVPLLKEYFYGQTDLLRQVLPSFFSQDDGEHPQQTIGPVELHGEDLVAALNKI